MKTIAKKFCNNILNENFNFTKELSSFSNKQISNLIECLKLSNFCVDFLDGNKYDSFLYHNHNVNSEMMNYLNQIKIINMVFKELGTLRNNLNSIAPEFRLKTLLDVHKELISNLEEVYLNQDKTVIEKADNIDALYDHLNQGIKFCCHDKEVCNNNYFLFCDKKTPDEFKTIAKQFMIDCCSYQKFLEEVYEVWRVGAGKLTKNENSIRFKIKSNKLYLTDLRNSAKEQFNREYELFVSRFYDCFNKKDFNLQYDASKTILKQMFYTNDLSTISINNFNIKHYITFYATLNSICREKIYKNTVLIINEKNVWIDLLCKCGLNKQFCNYIFDLSIFNKKSNNLFCYPFIHVGSDKYGMVTHIHKNSMPAYVLQERLLYEFSDVSAKGVNFENYLINYLNSKHINVFKLHNKLNGEEYEVDFAFTIDNTLYICECKDRVINFKNYDPEIKKNYIEQIQRNINFYKNNLNFIYDKTNKNNGLKINKIYGIIINAHPFCSNEKHNDIFIVDKETFIAPFRELNTNFHNHPQEIINIVKEQLSNQKILKYLSSSKDGINFLSYYDNFNFELNIGKYSLNYEGVGYKVQELSKDVEKVFSREKYLS